MRELFLVGCHIVSVALERSNRTRINVISSNIHVFELVYDSIYDANVAFGSINEQRLAYILNNTVLLSKRSKYTLISYTLN